MSQLLKTTVVALGLAGFAFTVPVTTAEAAPFYHKVCQTTYRHHHKHTTCHRVMFRHHPIRSILKEFSD
jgi:hypothetical protein